MNTPSKNYNDQWASLALSVVGCAEMLWHPITKQWLPTSGNIERLNVALLRLQALRKEEK